MSAGSVSGSGAESNAIAGTVCAAAVEPMAAMAAASKARFMSSPPRCRYLAGIELQNVEAGIAIDDVHEPAFIDVDIVGLRRRLARRRLRNEPADFAWRRRIGDVDDPQASREPGAVHERAFHVLLELMSAKARRRGAAPGRVELAHFVDRERLNRRDVGDVENPQAAMRSAAAALELLGAVRMVLFIDRHGDAAAVDSLRHRHEGMRRLGKWRGIVVFAKRARLANVGDADDAQACGPAARPELIAGAQRVVQAGAPADPGGLLAARDMLARHPPARHFLRQRRIADGVDDQNVADVALYLGRDIGVAAVHIEAMHAASPRALMLDELRPPAIGGVVELEAAVRVRGLL